MNKSGQRPDGETLAAKRVSDMRILEHPAPPVNRDDFECAFCGDGWPWTELAGWDKARKFCEACIRFLDHLNLPRTA